MNTCKNCINWTRNQEDGIDLKYGFCTSSNLISFEFGDLYPAPNENQLGFQTYDTAQFYSGENFGCIHFKQKDNEKDKTKS